ncbi:molecular chaperone DnaJ [Halobacteriales archaeon QS_4_69_34]|nr:MAG: molecular chaperone DnaJ [Halobacteriales archaeon QS_4_69_34]
MAENFYEILGVDSDASEAEITRAYRDKASEYHPDISDDPDAEEEFKKIQQAREVLTDSEKRQAYDRLGHERFEQAEKRGGFDAESASPGGGGRTGTRAGGDPFGGMGGLGGTSGAGGMGESIFEQFFGGRQGRTGGHTRTRRRTEGTRPQQGTDLRTDLTIDLQEAYRGAEKQLTVTRPERCERCGGRGHRPDTGSHTCPDCNGQGRMTEVRRTRRGRSQQTRPCSRCDGTGELAEPCSACGGDGRVRREATLALEIPPGIESGQTLRMGGEGAPGENGGADGDLLVEIAVREHPTFERDGADLHTERAISFPQAVFGDSVGVPTLDGTVEMRVPEGTRSGETFRLEGKGMPRLSERGYGDLYVDVHVSTPNPDALDDEQREALETLAGTLGATVQNGR